MKSKEFITEINSKDIKQLSKTLMQNRDKLHELKRDLALGKVKNYREITIIRKQIAQVMTAINNKAGQIIEETTKEKSDD